MTKFASTMSLLAAFFAVQANVAYAQSTEARSQEPLAKPSESEKTIDQTGDIIVTARKRAENLQRVPASVLAFGSDKIFALGAVRLDQLQSAAPGLTFGVNARISIGQIGIRGAVDFSQNTSYDARVGAFLDGVYIARSYGNNISLFGLERVEVVRGPQGTTFGNATAGAIGFVTRKPSEELNGEAEASGGSFGLRRFSGRVSGPLSDTVSVAATVESETSNGYLYNITRKEDAQGVDRLFGRLQVRIRPSDQLDINLSYTDQRDHNSSVGTISRWTDAKWANILALFPAYQGLPNTTTYQVANLGEQYEKSHSQFWIANVDYQMFTKARLTSTTAYQALGSTWYADFSGVPARARVQNLNERTHQFSQELRLASTQSDAFDYIVGAYYQFTKEDAAPYNLYGPDFTALRLLAAGTPVASIPTAVQTSVFRTYNNSRVTHISQVEDERLSAFVNLTYRPLPNVELAAGLRYTTVNKHLLKFTADDPLAANPATLASAAGGNFVATPDQRTDKNLSKQASITYRPLETISAYASYGEGFKAGGWNTGQITQAIFNNGLRVGVEKLHAYEVGIKSELFDKKLRLNVTGVFQKFPQYQVVQFAPGIAGGTAVPLQTNGASVTAKGVEAEFLARPFSGFSASGQVSYVKTRFADFPNGIALGRSATGNSPAYAPDLKWRVGVAYQHALQERVKALVGLDYSEQSKSFAAVANTAAQEIPGRHSLDARLSIAALDDNWTMTLYGKNLTKAENKVYSQVGAFGDLWSLYAEPRNFMLTLRKTV